MGRINIAELLKDCPKGMELDCTLCNNPVVLEDVVEDSNYRQIVITSKDFHHYFLTKYGCLYEYEDAKCVIFPKGKTTWEGFHRPFKDGDILVYKNKSNNLKYIFIYKRRIDMQYLLQYCGWFSEKPYFSEQFQAEKRMPLYENDDIKFATEEEKQKLFDAIKANGYKWNTETKTLEKLIEPKFNIEKGKWYVCTKDLLDNYANKAFCKGDTYLSTQDGSLIPSNSNVPFKVACASEYFRDWTIKDAKDGDVLFHSDSASNGIFIFKEISQRGTMQKVICYCDYDSEDGFCLGENHTCCWTDSKILHPATKEQCDLLFSKMKEAGYKWNSETKNLDKLTKFKVGDKIKHKSSNLQCTIGEYSKGISAYRTNIGLSLTSKDLEQWELAPNKFDITTLKPYDKILYRMRNEDTWYAGFYNIYKCHHHLVIGNAIVKQCIPYEGNEHLLGTTNNCNEFYKTWEE